MAAGPQLAVAGEKPIACPHCGNRWFWPRRIVMSSGTATLFGVDAFSPEAMVLSCSGCGRIELFQPAAVRLSEPTS
jgi:predicted nucleic-acid-binding Zn-ribbon protein